MNQFSIKQFIREAFRSGFIAAIAMIPFALLFSAMGLRINEYGKKVIQFLFPDFSPGIRFALFVIEHFILSRTFAIPLLIPILLNYFHHHRISYLLIGAVNALALIKKYNENAASEFPIRAFIVPVEQSSY